MLSEQIVKATYPLHYAIWVDDEAEVEMLLKNPEVRKCHLEKLDPRGRTPLVLAVLKGRVSVVDRLLNKYNADATFTQESGWNVIHEAVSIRHKGILRMVLARRDLQRCQKQEQLIPELLQELKNAPDFYVEMRWVFSTWVPYMNRMLPPGQSYRVYKKGSSLRVDCVSADSSDDWNTGISLIFKEEGNDIFVFEIDHNSKRILKQIICASEAVLNGRANAANGRTYDEIIATRLMNPSVVSITDWKSVSFKRRQHTVAAYASMIGLGELTEQVDGYKCKLFDSTGFGIQTKFRTEHLSEQEKSKFMAEETPGMLKKILSYLSKYDADERDGDEAGAKAASYSDEPTLEEYFDPNLNLGNRDIGPPREIKSKRVKFDATVWICENYPLDLKEQLVPIINLMSLTNSRFKTLKDFIELQMPGGFPVRLQVPIYPMVNGQISFHNIFGSQHFVDGVTTTEDFSTGKQICKLDDAHFTPPNYEMKTAVCFGPDLASEDDDFFGIFRDGDPNEPEMDIYEALNAPRTLRDSTPDDAEEQMLQRAIEESLLMERLRSNPGRLPGEEPLDGAAAISAAAFGGMQSDFERTPSFDDLEKAIELSRAESEAMDRSLREEEEMLRRVLEMSLQEF